MSLKALSLTALAIVILIGCYMLNPDPVAWLPLAVLMALVATHLDFYRYVVKKRNLAFAIAVVPMQLLFFLGCAVSIPLALIRHHRAKRPAPAHGASSDDP